MSKNRLRRLFLLASIFFTGIANTFGQVPADSVEARIDRTFDLVRDHFSGEQAYKTVAFVEKYWRIAGNTGFNASIEHVAEILQNAGYVYSENPGKDDTLTFQIEKRPMAEMTWEPVSGSLNIVGEKGEEEILNFDTNRNMIAVNSWSTPESGIEAELVYIKSELTEEELNQLDVRGKIVFAEQHPWRLYNRMVREKGARGLIIYSNPDYLQPEKNAKSIQFKSIPQDSVNRSFAIITSFSVKEKLKKSLSLGPMKVKVKIETRLYESEELTLVANVHGRKYPDHRIVFSAHVQEPGANDNASGVGVQAEMARVTANLVKSGEFMPDRTITFLFGDEIISTRRYIEEDQKRASGIMWGVSLDMVGENTEITGGTFLIEKMPDPSVIWTRGDDRHTEWGGSPMTKEQLQPGYLNDFVETIFIKQGEYANWTVNVNPFEGGSDHVPFLRADIPSVLLWHFTDKFYHTDGDRIDKVSKETLQNVGTAALVTCFTLVNGDKSLAEYLVELLDRKANVRLMNEYTLSKSVLASGGDKGLESEILTTWSEYYQKSLQAVKGAIYPVKPDKSLEDKIRSYQKRMDLRTQKFIRRLN